jgi:hypothetical protein
MLAVFGADWTMPATTSNAMADHAVEEPSLGRAHDQQNLVSIKLSMRPSIPSRTSSNK